LLLLLKTKGGARETAEKSMDAIKSGQFFLQPGQFCESCDYSRICSSCQRITNPFDPISSLVGISMDLALTTA
jgi:hypothetical protein